MPRLVLDEPKGKLVLDEPKPPLLDEFYQTDFGVDFDRYVSEGILPEPVTPAALKPLLTPQLESDEFRNSAWFALKFGTTPEAIKYISPRITEEYGFNPVKATPEQRGFFGKIIESWRRGSAEVAADISMYEAAFEGRGDEDRILATLKKLRQKEAIDPIEGRFMAELVYSSVRILPGMGKGYWSAVPEAFKGMVGGAIIAASAGQVPPLTLLPEEALTIPVGAVTGTKAGLMVGSAHFWYKQGAGSMYTAMKEAGYDTEISKHVAGVAAIPYAVVELLQVAQLTPGLRRTLLNTGKKSMMRVIGRAVKRYGTTWTEEVFEEIVQEIIQIVAEDMAGVLSDKLKMPEGVSKFLMDRGRRIWETTKAAAKSMTLLPIPGAAIDIYTGKRSVDKAVADRAALEAEKPAVEPKAVAPTEIEALAKELEESLKLKPERALEVAAKKLAYDEQKAKEVAKVAEKPPEAPPEAITPEKPPVAPAEAPAGKVERFVADKLGIKVETIPTDPKNKYAVALGQQSTFVDKDNRLEVWLKETSDQVILSQIKVEKEKTGLATKFVNQLKNYSDEMNKKLIIPNPTPTARKFLSKFKWLEIGVLRENGVVETTLEYAPTPAKPAKVIELVKQEPTKDTKLRQQIHAVAAVKGLTKKALEELKQKHTGYRHLTGKIAQTKISTEQLEALLKAVQKARPKQVGYKKVITQKTEKKIVELKKNLKAKLQMTDEAFTEILQKEIRGKEPKYIDAKRFITETEGKDIIKRMHDAAEVLKVTESFDKAIREKPEIAKQVNKLKAEIARKTKRDPYRVESMRYYAQQSEAKVGAPIFSMYMDLLDTHLKTHKTRHARILTLEKEVPGFKQIAGDEEALTRVSQYIASQSELKDKPAPPVDITASEKKLASQIQKIFREYELKARVSKFFNWYYYGEGIAEFDRYVREIHKAEDIYESQGKEELITYLRTQEWGVIRSGYEPLEMVIMKVQPWTTGPKTVGKSHIKIRTNIEYHTQERNILQRLNAYMRQMDMLYNLSPKINAFIRLYDDNMSKFDNPGKVKESIEHFIANLKKYNIEGSWVGDAMARMYAQAAQIIIMAQPVLAFRNTFQNAAFEHDKTILFDPRNEPLTPDEMEYRETYVQQMRSMMEEYFMVNEKALPGTQFLMKILRKIKIYAWSDVANRDWGFWAKINQVKRAQKAETIEQMMDWAKFEDMTEIEQIRTLGILARDGKEAMAMYAARVHVDDIHFLYERAQRSPAEMGTLGRVFGNLMLFPRAYTEKLAHAVSKLTSPTSSQTERYRAAKILVSVMGGGFLVGVIYTMITGRKRNPYDPFELMNFRLGGLILGLTQDVNETYNLTVRALSGDKKALYALTTILPRLADVFIPFYDWTLRGMEATLDMKNIDRMALRTILAAIDKEYKVRKGAYKMKRDLVKTLQHVFAKPGEEKPKKKKKLISGK